MSIHILLVVPLLLCVAWTLSSLMLAAMKWLSQFTIVRKK